MLRHRVFGVPMLVLSVYSVFRIAFRAIPFPRQYYGARRGGKHVKALQTLINNVLAAIKTRTKYACGCSRFRMTSIQQSCCV